MSHFISQRPTRSRAAFLALAILGGFGVCHAAPKPKAKVVTTKSGLKYQDLKKGKGAFAKAGKTATVHYIGKLTNGKLFDTSKQPGRTPFEFQIGAGQVIKGWDEGVSGMRVGGVRRLTIPPALGYGASGAGGLIPPNATLIFQVELLGVK